MKKPEQCRIPAKIQTFRASPWKKKPKLRKCVHLRHPATTQHNTLPLAYRQKS
jgi:hypothetical protein